MKRTRLPLLLLTTWDLGWRTVAVRTALRRGDRKWAAALALVTSGGLLPMFYLARRR